jgi:hypothetical protein
MLIKIDKDRYINSEHISMIAPGVASDEYFILLLGQDYDKAGVQTTATVVAYLAMILDADENYSDDPVELSLTSRIAIYLSNSANARSLEEIPSFFDAPLEEIEVSINELLAQGVITSELRHGIPYYSHAAHGSPFEDLAVLDNGDSAW